MQDRQTTVEIKIDFRERTLANRKYIEQLPKNINVHYTQLSVGDYIIDNKIIIERKTVADFMASVKDSRIFRQAQRLAANRLPGLFIIEDIQGKEVKRYFNPHALTGVMVYLTVIAGIPVLWSGSYSETLFIITSIARQLQALHARKKIFYYENVQKNPIVNNRHQKIAMLQAIPGVGVQKAKSLLKYFKTVRNIALADEEQLIKVRGIGKNISRSIISVFQ